LIELFLFDIIVAISKIEYAVSKFDNPNDLKHDFMAWDSVIREFEIIGEASKHLLKSELLAEDYRSVVDFRNVLIHGYFGIDEDNILVRDLLKSIGTACLLEDYPEFGKGPCVLLLQTDKLGMPIHTVWGIPKDKKNPAVLITAYRPDPEKWSDDFKRRL
jgi:uncharacterized protein with HEPN domain